MKIAFISPYHHQEGLSEYSRMLITGLESLGGVGEVEVELFDVDTILPRSRWFCVDEINKGGFDLVHLQHELAHWGSFTNPLCVPRFFEFCEKIKIPKVVTFHSVDLKGETWKKWGWWGRWRFVQMHSLPQASIVHSHYLKDGLVQMGVPGLKIQVIPIGVPGLEGGGRKVENGRWRGSLRNKRIVSIFGFINPDKGYEVVLQALAGLPKDVVFVIAGGIQDQSNQNYLNTLNSLISQMGLQDRVAITGFLEKDEMLALMQHAEVVLFPRTHVNASLELSLAIALQKPILASNLSYFVEVNARVPCLEIFDLEGDRVENFRKKLLRLLDDKDRQQELAKNCAQYAQKYSWGRVAKQTVSVYESVL